METFICFLPITENGNQLQVKTTWDQTKMSITILDNNADTAWTGILSYSLLSQHHHSLNISEHEHKDKCKEVLSTNQGVQGFSYHLENDCFIWKKKILTDMKIKFGQIDVQKVPVSQVRNEFMMALISKVEILESKSKTDEEKIRKLESENTELLATLEEFTQVKQRDEQILYGKFTALLNTKKQRVACLEKMMFKNLCSDAEESKAGDNRQHRAEDGEDTNWNEDTDPEDESMDPIPGPSGIRISTVICEDTDEEDNNPNRSLSDDDPGPPTNRIPPVRIRSPIPSTSGYKNIDSRQPTKDKVSSHEEIIPIKKLKLSPEKSGVIDMLGTNYPPREEKKKLPKPVSEMDSQELLDLL